MKCSSLKFAGKTSPHKVRFTLSCNCTSSSSEASVSKDDGSVSEIEGRRAFMACVLTAGIA